MVRPQIAQRSAFRLRKFAKLRGKTSERYPIPFSNIVIREIPLHRIPDSSTGLVRDVVRRFWIYVSFVVPVGNEVLGSSFEQGLITRQVTVPLNWLGVLAATLMALNLLFNRKQFTRAVSTIQVIAVVVMLSMQVALFWLHPQIDTFVDLETHEIVGDYDQFYWFHRLYLWASTIQWFAGWLWLACFALPNRVTTEVEQVVQV